MSKVTSTRPSDLDWQILSLLAADGRRTVSDLATTLGVSRSTVSERIERLRADGIIRGFSPDIDEEKLGFGVSAFVRLRAPSGRHRDIVAAVDGLPEVGECHVLAGSDLLLMRIFARDIAHLRSVVDKLTRFGDTQTDVVFATVRRAPVYDDALRDVARAEGGAHGA